jgi:CheY-like chemotaxis protein
LTAPSHPAADPSGWTYGPLDHLRWTLPGVALFTSGRWPYVGIPVLAKVALVTHRIVVIDGSEDLRFVLRFSLESRGLAVTGEAGMLQEGVDVTATTQPDAVVADVNLLDESDLATIVARLPAAAPRAAVIALSAPLSADPRSEPSVEGLVSAVVISVPFR